MKQSGLSCTPRSPLWLFGMPGGGRSKKHDSAYADFTVRPLIALANKRMQATSRAATLGQGDIGRPRRAPDAQRWRQMLVRREAFPVALFLSACALTACNGVADKPPVGTAMDTRADSSVAQYPWLTEDWVTLRRHRHLRIEDSGRILVADSSGAMLDSGQVYVVFSKDSDPAGFKSALVLRVQITSVNCLVAGYFGSGEGDPSSLTLLLPGMMDGHYLAQALGAESAISVVELEYLNAP